MATMARAQGVPPRPSGVQRVAAEHTRRTLRRRRIVSVAMVGVTHGAALMATLPLLLILFLVTFVVNAVAKLLVMGVTGRGAHGGG